MAPYSCNTDFAKLNLSTKQKNKLRKPAVEKMRRDRINSCIEQLKKLLEKECHQRDPTAKLEKADVLEMTVRFLKKQLQPRAAGTVIGHSEGYTQCWKETLRFLSNGSKMATPLQTLHCFQGIQMTTQQLCPASPSRSSHSPVKVKQEPGAEGTIWRPW